MVRAAIYARVSTDEQGYGFSLPTQIEGCLTYARERGYSILEAYKEEYTGTSLDRPELDKVRELAEARLIDKIIVYDLDRFARGLAKQIILEEEFRRYGIGLDIVLAEYEDSPEGKLQKNVRAVIAEYEREKFLERSSRGKKGRLKAGHVMPSAVAPYGFRYVPSENGHGGTYEIVGEEARIVRWIYEWYVYGDETGRRLGAPSIALKLTAMGIPTRYDTMANPHNKKRKRGQWNVKAITDMLASEMYAGICYWGKTGIVNGKRVAKDKSKWIPVNVPMIIPRDLWEAAQRQKQHNKVVSVRNTKGEYLLQGYIRCARCGRLCSIQSPVSNRQARYRCATAFVRRDFLANEKCQESILQPKTDELVWNAIRQILEHPETVIRAADDQRQEIEKANGQIRERIAIAQQGINERQRKRDMLLDCYLDNQFSRDTLNERAAALAIEIQKLEAEIKHFETHLLEVPKLAINPDTMRAQLDKIARDLDHITFAGKRAVLDILEVAVTAHWRGQGKANLHLSGLFPEWVIEVGDFADTSCKCGTSKNLPFTLIIDIA